MSTLINATMAAIVYLFYIGSKPEKRDTITDTGITWFGFGDKQAVPAAQAAVLLRHRDVWVTEDEFKKGVEEGRYKPRELASLTPALPDDIDLDADGFNESDLDDPMDDGDESKDATSDEIITLLLSMDISEKPKIADVRAAYSAQGGTKEISTKALNAAWASLN